MWQCLIAIICVGLIVCGSCYHHHHVILSGDNDSCPQGVSSCHTLSYYANRSDAYFKNDTIFTFTEGVHILRRQELVAVSSVNNLTFVGMGSVEPGHHETILQSTVVVQCEGATGFYFDGTIDVGFHMITFRFCGGTTEDSEDLVSAVSFSLSGRITMESVSIQNGMGIGLMISKSYDISIDKCSFLDNRGNVYVNSALSDTSILVTQTNFTLGNITGTLATAGGLGICIQLYSQYSLNVGIYIRDVVFFRNVGGNMVTNIYGIDNSSIHIDNIQSIGGMSEYIQGPALDLTIDAVSTILNVFNSHFTNSGTKGGVSVSVGEFSRAEISFANCSLHGNALPALVFSTGLNFGVVSLCMNLHNVTISHNDHAQFQEDNQGTLVLKNIPNCVLDAVSIVANGLTGLLCISSMVTFSGSNHFIGNHGDRGGAIAMYESSSLAFDYYASIHFTDNEADRYGGAIYVAAATDHEDCFYKHRGLSAKQPHMFFNGNRAGTAGDVLYGGNINACTEHSTYPFFNVSGQEGLSVITSNATGVCFCVNGRPNCQLKQMNYSLAPGERFKVPVAVIGEGGGLTVGVAQFWSSNTRTLSNLVSTDQARSCIEREVMANSSIDRISVEYFDLLLSEDASNVRTIHITTTKCPVGFSLQNGVCDCNEQLMKLSESPKITITCSVTHRSVTRAGNAWLALDGGCVKALPDCPFDYCKLGSVTVTANNSDAQCDYGRTGVLCGECLGGHSLQLGSNKCKKCSHASLFLLIPFSLAGIALVALLIVLNLTVSVGTINGLIFYANVVKLYQPVFFQTRSIPVLGQFISWLNLDLGIEMCFYDGMGACGKTWLQFVFPVYIWVLISAIIFLASRSQRFTKLVGTNAIQVLATLILLSYTKLIRTVILSLYHDHVVCGDSTTTVWRVNGTVEFLTGCHLPIFVLSLLVLAVMILPYTLLLLTFPLFECRLSKYQLGIKLSLYLRPFFDAYGGPYKDCYRFWLGLLLVMRVVLALTMSVASKEVSTDVLSGVAVVLVSVHLFSGSSVYRSAWNSYLEVALLLDLILMSHIAGQADSIPDSRRLGYNIVLLSFALLVFLGVLLYHMWKRIVQMPLWNSCKRILSRFRKEPAAETVKIDDNSLTRPSQTIISLPLKSEPYDKMIKCKRETLLIDDGYIDYADAHHAPSY